MLHRDLKPANLRQTADGRVKILDFGLALLSREAVATLSTVGESLAEAPSGIAGTLPYMSPEQLLGERLDERSDLYSAGVVLFELATARLPFTDTLSTKLTNAILREAPSPPSSLAPKMSAELDRIILKCLDKDPELRYQSAKELAADLRRMELWSARSATELQAAPVRLTRRHWIAPLFGAVAAIVITTVVVLALMRLRDHQASSGPPAVRWEQITNFTDSASDPALSRDGKMVAFIRGGDNVGQSASPGQIWVKLLPNGDPVQLTHDPLRKNSPAFSPDAGTVAYTQLNKGFLWDTWEVPVLGGEARLLLPNASSANWLNGTRLMYSEVKPGGVHMGIVVSGRSRSEERAVYWPAAANMAHHSELSPDGTWVLVVEMDGTGWLPCRVVPFDGSGQVRVVGPDGPCTSAKWSPDGKWMYFSAKTGGAYHLWRQKFPDGVPEQLTAGGTEEEHIAVAPDGKSLITAVGSRESIVWIHDSKGNRQITSDGYSFLPTITRDMKSVYYLKENGAGRSFVSGELWSANLASGRQERVLPGYVLAHYDVSPDGRQVVFAVAEGGGVGIWIAPLDRNTPPRQLTSGGEYRAFFISNTEILYMTRTQPRHLFRIKADGSDRKQLVEDEVLHLMSVSPDGRWAAAVLPARQNEVVHVVAYPLAGGPPTLLCDTCIGGFGPARANAPLVSWSPDGKLLYASLHFFAIKSEKTVAVPVKEGTPGPLLTPRPDVSEQYFSSLPGAQMINERDVFPGPTAGVYAYTKRARRSNLFRLTLGE